MGGFVAGGGYAVPVAALGALAVVSSACLPTVRDVFPAGSVAFVAASYVFSAGFLSASLALSGFLSALLAAGLIFSVRFAFSGHEDFGRYEL